MSRRVEDDTDVDSSQLRPMLLTRLAAKELKQQSAVGPTVTYLMEGDPLRGDAAPE